MNNDIRKYFKSLITVDKMQLLSNKHLLEDVVDKINVKEYKKEYFLISSSLDEDIPQDILVASGINDCTLLKSTLVQRLENNLGFSKEVAIWTVETWMCVLDMESESINDNNVLESSKEREITLIKDEFETYEEWKNRILRYNPIKVGKACLIKELYDIDTGKFPMKIQIDCVLDDMELLDSDTYIIVNRDVARNLYSTKESNWVYLTLDFDEYGLCVKKVEMYWGQVQIQIMNTLINITIRDERLVECISNLSTIKSVDSLYSNKREFICKNWRIFTHSTGPKLAVRKIPNFRESKYDNIYKARIGTEEYLKLNSYESRIIGIVNDLIYFVNVNMDNAFFYMNLNGDNVTKFFDSYEIKRYSATPIMIKNYIYFIADIKGKSTLCKLTVDGVCTILDESYSAEILDIDDKFIYYVLMDYDYYRCECTEKHKLCKIDINTNSIVQKIEVKLKQSNNYRNHIAYNLRTNDLYVKYAAKAFGTEDLTSIPRIVQRISLL